jgi:hypothetical protein
MGMLRTEIGKKLIDILEAKILKKDTKTERYKI